MPRVFETRSHAWADEIHVPTAVIIPRRDRINPPARQHRLAAAIPGASTYEIDGGHGVFLTAPDRFVTALSASCHLVEPFKIPADPRPAGVSPPARGRQAGRS